MFNLLLHSVDHYDTHVYSNIIYIHLLQSQVKSHCPTFTIIFWYSGIFQYYLTYNQRKSHFPTFIIFHIFIHWYWSRIFQHFLPLSIRGNPTPTFTFPFFIDTHVYPNIDISYYQGYYNHTVINVYLLLSKVTNHTFPLSPCFHYWSLIYYWSYLYPAHL